MKAMILAAGFGTRLRPLTNEIPKALVKIAGKPMLERTIHRLQAAGVTDIIINTHHCADQVHHFLQNAPFPGLTIAISQEEKILDTGGGLKKAQFFFTDDRPFILHNVDVVSTFDLNAMYEFHLKDQPLVTIAVQKRQTRRPLLMDRQNRLCGRVGADDNNTRLPFPGFPPYQSVAFNGVHVIDPKIFELMQETGVFAIFDVYLRLVVAGHRIHCYDIGDNFWLDLGKPEALTRLDEAIAAGKIVY